jgi:hypothetical protein
MLLRRAMRRDLRSGPEAWLDAPGPPGVRFEEPGRTAAELAGAFVAACPPRVHPLRRRPGTGSVVGAALVTGGPGDRALHPGALLAATIAR